MRKIAETFYAVSPAMGYAILALLLFMVIFTLVIFRISKKDRSSFESLAAMPLIDDEYAGEMR